MDHKFPEFKDMPLKPKRIDANICYYVYNEKKRIGIVVKHANNAYEVCIRRSLGANPLLDNSSSAVNSLMIGNYIWADVGPQWFVDNIQEFLDYCKSLEDICIVFSTPDRVLKYDVKSDSWK